MKRCDSNSLAAVSAEEEEELRTVLKELTENANLIQFIRDPGLKSPTKQFAYCELIDDDDNEADDWRKGRCQWTRYTPAGHEIDRRRCCAATLLPAYGAT